MARALAPAVLCHPTAAKHLLTSAEVCQDLSVCRQEPSPGFAPRDLSGVLVVLSLLVLEQENAVHIQGAGSELGSGTEISSAVVISALAGQGPRPCCPTKGRGLHVPSCPLCRCFVLLARVTPALSGCGAVMSPARHQAVMGRQGGDRSIAAQLSIQRKHEVTRIRRTILTRSGWDFRTSQ